MSMELQISSGRGPVECELAVGKYADALCQEYTGTVIKQKTAGLRTGCYKSIIIGSACDLRCLVGTVQWVCQSPFRPKHKRKNWFIDVSVVAASDNTVIYDAQIRFQTFLSGGKGGQHVNKVATGVRATYAPLGVSAISTDERSQRLNRKLAKERLFKLIAARDAEDKCRADRYNWLEHNSLIRGNAVRVYEGLEFRRVL